MFLFSFSFSFSFLFSFSSSFSFSFCPNLSFSLTLFNFFLSFTTASGFSPLSLGAIIGGSIGLVFLLILLASILVKRTDKRRFPAIHTNYHTRNGIRIREKRDSIPDAFNFIGMGLDKDLGSDSSDMISVEAVVDYTQSMKEVFAEQNEVQSDQSRQP